MFDITTYILSKDFTTKVVNKQAGRQIVLADYTGQLDEEQLKILKESTSSTIILDNKLYRLSATTNKEFKYIASATDGESVVLSMTELVINKRTGEFQTKNLIVDQTPVEELKAEFEAHRDNADIHVTLEDKAYWNNKVSAEVTPDGANYQLNLIK